MKDLEYFKDKLNKIRYDEDEQLSFVWEIMKSPYVEYHYSLMKERKS